MSADDTVEDKAEYKKSRLTEQQRQRFPIVTDAPDTDTAQTYTVFSYNVSAIGFIALLTGGYFMLFGPEVIRYNVVSGMTFHQTLQAYPGPIASLGFVAFAIGRAIGGAADQKQASAMSSVVETALQRENIAPEDIGDDYRLDIQKREDERLEVDLVRVAE